MEPTTAGKPHELGSMFIVYVATLLFFAIGAVTTPQLGWYQTLSVPNWTPPELLIAGIWCLLFVLTTISMSLYWEHPEHDKAFSLTASLYIGNAALVIAWNYLFFGIHNIGAAFWIAILVGLSVIAIMLRVRRVSTTASLLLTPYVVWVAFAAYLLYSIMQMN